MEALNTRDYATIAARMAPVVSFTIESTGCCVPGTPDSVVGNLSWLNQGTPPWSFDQSHPRVVSIKSRYASTHGGSMMAFSTNGIIAAFWFDEAGRIEAIRAANGRLFDP
ncbi:MAG: hypothetical protein AB7I38_07745 [Dehalococcoidia bacterium]